MTSVSNSRGSDVEGGAEGTTDESSPEGAADESVPVVSGVADAAGELAAAGPATVMGVAATTEVKPRWGSSQEYWRTAPKPPSLAAELDLNGVRAVQNESFVFSMK